MLEIKLTDLHPIFNDLDLMQNPQLRLRLRVKEGYSKTTTATTCTGIGEIIVYIKTMSLSSTNLRLGTVCPVMLADVGTNLAKGSLFDIISRDNGQELTLA